MNYLRNSTKLFKQSKIVIAVIIFTSLTSCFLTRDNAVNLAYNLEKAAKKLESQKIGSEFIINFKPVDTASPFTILVLSEKGITFDELIEKGLDPIIVEDLFPQLSYINLKNSATLIVYQNGTISFTTYYRRFVDVKTTQIISSSGNTDIHVKTLGVVSGNLSDEVLLIELK